MASTVCFSLLSATWELNIRMIGLFSLLQFLQNEQVPKFIVMEFLQKVVCSLFLSNLHDRLLILFLHRCMANLHNSIFHRLALVVSMFLMLVRLTLVL